MRKGSVSRCRSGRVKCAYHDAPVIADHELLLCNEYGESESRIRGKQTQGADSGDWKGEDYRAIELT